MVPLYTVSFPRLGTAEQALLDAVRTRHDARNARLIPPHFTLVFACAGLDEQEYVAHVREVAARTPHTPFACRRAVLDTTGERDATHVYFVPDDGASRITQLHDRLYKGPLAPHLRRDLPYFPHITVGTFDSPTDAESLCDHLNTHGVYIDGVIEKLSIGSLQENRFRIHATCALQRGAKAE